MKAGQRVKITKLQPVDNAAFPTPRWTDHTPGSDNPGQSLPVEYWIEGTLLANIVVGSCVRVNRDVRNGVVVSGLFTTSPVQSISPGEFCTMNSVYKVELLV